MFIFNIRKYFEKNKKNVDIYVMLTSIHLPPDKVRKGSS